MIHKDKKDLKGTNVLKYIRDGESKGYHTRPTCDSRERWYDLGKREPGTLLIAMIQAYRHIVFYNPSKVFPDHNLFEVLISDGDRPRKENLLTAYLSSLPTMLAKELVGRSYGGGSGPLKLEGIDIERIPVLQLGQISDSEKASVLAKFKAFQGNSLEDTFSELGASTPDDVSLDKVKPDRRELLGKLEKWTAVKFKTGLLGTLLTSK
jgi:hypothetical protein